ncbi:hypothetical protein H7200_01455, partial [Candidatus Saccharibacteria bacterium]|nr:hypothetical protein [Candidatus Saccharibacteria bacterium]
MKKFKPLFLIVIAFVMLFSFSTTVSAAEKPKVECDTLFDSLNNVLFYSACADDCTATSSLVGSVTGADNREKIYNYLRAKGLSPEQSAGVTGNIQNESGFSPTRQESSQSFPAGGWGIVQWTFGRRSDPSPDKGVVAYLNSKIPDVMSQYYTAAFGGGATEASGFVPSGLPVDANDKILLNSLDFLYKESTSRQISSRTVSKIENGAAGDSEWDTLKKQTTISGASNLWVYNFEIPADIDTTATARVKSGQTIF